MQLHTVAWEKSVFLLLASIFIGIHIKIIDIRKRALIDINLDICNWHV